MTTLSRIEDALEDFKAGKLLIVVDDQDRENEGDFVCAAEKITPETVNFMLHHGRGVLCAPMAPELCERLEMDMMVRENTSHLGTPFTVSVDLLGEGCTTGVSASDRAATIRALACPSTRAEQLGRPGHIFALKARPRRGAGTQRAYRGRSGHGAYMRTSACRRLDRNNEPRRDYGAPAATSRNSA